MKGPEEEGRWSMWNCCVLLLKVSISLLSALPVTKIQVSQLYLSSFLKYLYVGAHKYVLNVLNAAIYSC